MPFLTLPREGFDALCEMTKRVCIRVGSHYIRWSDWYWRWTYTSFKRADRFDLQTAIKIAEQIQGEVLPIMNKIVVAPIHFEDHPYNSTLKVAEFGDFQVVVGDHYEQGQLGFYIPEGAIVPEKLLREMWLFNEDTGKGRLAGKKGNRVKPRIFDRVMSDGLFYGSQGESWNPTWEAGQDITLEIGITFPQPS